MRLLAALIPLLLTIGPRLEARAEFVVPELSSPVIDEAGLLSRADRREISDVLRNFNARGKAQMQVLIVDTLDGTPIESATIKAVEKWKLGHDKKDNGVLFLVAISDRKMRLEVGYGLEGAIPDAEAKRILAETVAPLFRTKRYSAGIVQAVYEVLRHADAEFAESNPAPDQGAGAGDDRIIGILALFLFILVFIGRFASTGSRYHRGAYGRGWRTGGFGGGWGGGGSTGGGWSGGGGGFGGGGASSNW